MSGYGYDQEQEDLANGYRDNPDTGEYEIYDPDYGWITEEELLQMESEMNETRRRKTMKTTIPKLRRIIRQVIKESYEEGGYNTIAGRAAQDNARRNRPPTLPETLEAIEIIKSFGGNYNTSVYEPGENYSDEHREVIVGRAGDAVVMVTVTPDRFSAQISEGEKGYEQAELPGQKGKVNPNDFFARGADFNSKSIAEFEAQLEEAMEAYSVPMRSRGRRSGARKAGYEHFRTK